MQQTRRLILTVILFIGVLLLATKISWNPNSLDSSLLAFSPSALNQGCSVIYNTDGTHMLGGNNEDYANPLTKVWFIPGEGEGFGKVYFGFEDFRAQGGMNEAGLFFDALALDAYYPISTEGKQAYEGNLTDKILSECATVDCAIENFQNYYSLSYWNWQFFFGDAKGTSAIIEPDAIIRQSGGYQAATNFLQSVFSQGESSDTRYLTAIEGLKGMDDLSIENLRDILDAIHVDADSKTLYSNVYDLNHQIVYLYYFHHFADVVLINLEEELAKGYHAYDLPSLFPTNPEAEKWAATKLTQRESLLDSQMETSVSAERLAAYAGEYEMLDGWGEVDETLLIIPQEQSLLLRFPDYHQYELFPSSPNDFFCVLYLESEFQEAFQVRFVLDAGDQVQYFKLLMGDQVFRSDRLEPGSVMTMTPSIAAPAEQTGVPMPTRTEPAQAFTETLLIGATPPEQPEKPGGSFLAGWHLPAVVILAVGAAVVVVIVLWRRRSQQK